MAVTTDIGYACSTNAKGYSHGSLIASLHPVLLAPIRTAHVLLSYPLGPRGWLTLFHASYYQAQLEQLVQDPESNVLVIYGDRDEFTSKSSYEGWVEKLERGSTGLRATEIENGGHFWGGRSGQVLQQAVAEWLSGLPN